MSDQTTSQQEQQMPAAEEKKQNNLLIMVLGVGCVIAVALLIFGQSIKKTTDEKVAKQQEEQTITYNKEEFVEPVAQMIEVEGGGFYFKPNELRVKKGKTVRLTFKNADGFHDFVIDELNVRTKQINGGENDIVEFTPDKAGTFKFYCSVGKHRQMGMEGTIIVEE
jgi:plastocyanin